MAYVASTRSVSTGRDLGNRLVEIGRDLVCAWRAHRVYRRTLAELQGLSARDLDDLGLEAATLTKVAFEATYGKTGLDRP